MNRLGSLSFCAILGAGLLACGSSTSTKNILDLVPRANTVPGWTIDPDNAKTTGQVAATATTEAGAGALIDGAAADLFMAPNIPAEFAWQNYVNSTLPDAPDGAHVKLYILRMPSAEQAKGRYTSLLQASYYTRKAGTPDDWQDPTKPLVGDDSRIQDTGDHWWINFRKNVFYVEVLLDPSQGPAPDFAPGNANTKQETFLFAQAVAHGM